MGQPGLEKRTPVGTRVPSGEDFITYRRMLEVSGACLGKIQASCAFQMAAAGSKCMLGRSPDKVV